ncbi:uncharacterized protein LOC124480751 isoform X1 [Hypomesus transpacificus]|uniref:uncharacterized protein LOC124480751 isoform X1 n=1 Tax=Hypomesus transpacificus TaxID=137520 RepID=UPI001F084A18|nr:uncharacterized protein LOC124480751 isoform X1 [Hypomesus transpacificus]
MTRCLVLLSSVALSQSLTEKHAHCNDNVSLQCMAVQGDRNYRSITWYKLNNRTGIIRKSENKTTKFKFNRTVHFGADDSLALPSVRPEDGGIYQCATRANIGKKNRESDIQLTVSDCVTPVYLTTTVTYKSNMNSSTPHFFLPHVGEVSTLWSVTGFLVVNLVKLSLCLIFIWVSKAIKRKLLKQKRQRWQR